MIRKAKVETLEIPYQGYRYNVQEWNSVDGGRTYFYSGIGKYFRLKSEAVKYASSFDDAWRL